MSKIKTQFTIFMVSLHLVRAGNFERKSQWDRLYETYASALERMRRPGVDRNHPMIRLLVLTVTKHVEKLSTVLKKPGAGAEDLQNSLDTLRGVPGVSKPTGEAEDQQWIEGFEKKLSELQVPPFR